MSKKYPEDTESKHSTIRIPKDMLEGIEKFLKTESAKEEGFLSKTDVATAAVRELLEKKGYYPKKSRFKHINLFEDHAAIRDFALNQEINIYFQHEQLFCEHCDAHNCEHIRFLLEEEDLRQKLIEKGFKLPE